MRAETGTTPLLSLAHQQGHACAWSDDGLQHATKRVSTVFESVSISPQFTPLGPRLMIQEPWTKTTSDDAVEVVELFAGVGGSHLV